MRREQVPLYTWRDRVERNVRDVLDAIERLPNGEREAAMAMLDEQLHNRK